MSNETIFANARLGLPDQVVPGSMCVAGDCIARIDRGRSVAPGALDMEGDYLIPGIVDLHTDNLERQVQPRSLLSR